MIQVVLFPFLSFPCTILIGIISHFLIRGMVQMNRRYREVISKLLNAHKCILDFSIIDKSSTPYYENTWNLSRQLANDDMKYIIRVMYDHGTNDWRDVIQNKINVPTAIFTGELSPNFQSQNWIHSVIPNSEFYVYTKEEYGNHSLMEKNPVKFSEDLKEYLEK